MIQKVRDYCQSFIDLLCKEGLSQHPILQDLRFRRGSAWNTLPKLDQLYPKPVRQSQGDYTVRRSIYQT